jgi:benzoyl-CoA reductase/2-hydroxyglutaryl-CoA dehydratase subunit BcrC/BadD/HgdB
MGVATEIYVGMDLVGNQHDMIAVMLGIYLGSQCQDDSFDAAKAIGIRPEICSPHRSPIGWFAKGWYPKPTAILSDSMNQCDNCSQAANVMGALYDVPVFCINRPYRYWTQRGIDYMVGEIKSAIAFLEEKTGHKMDWEKLKEAVSLTKRQMEISIEIHNLLKVARPCPIKAGTGFLIHWIRMQFAGRKEGVDYCQAFLDDMKENVAQGKGYAPKEKYRLINIFTWPVGQHKVLDWMEQEAGAVIVAEPMYHMYNESELAKVDPSKPLDALARFYYLEPYDQFYGPLAEYTDMIVNDAIESGAEGAINFFNSHCRLGGAAARTIKDQLKEKVGIPTLSADLDILDPSEAVGAHLKEQLEQFFLILDNAKKKRLAHRL